MLIAFQTHNKMHSTFCIADFWSQLISIWNNIQPVNGANVKEVDEIFEERCKRLRRSSSPQFTEWRMKFHNETLATYLHSMKEFNEEMKSLQEQIIE